MAQIIGYDQEKMRQATCKCCLAIVEYAPADVDSRDYTYEFFVKCPGCDADIEVERWRVEDDDDDDC